MEEKPLGLWMPGEAGTELQTVFPSKVQQTVSRIMLFTAMNVEASVTIAKSHKAHQWMTG